MRIASAKQIANDLQNCKKAGRPAVILCGAGVSSGSFPLGTEFFKKLKNQFDERLSHIEPTRTTLVECVASVEPENILTCIRKWNNEATINAANAGIAQLCSQNFIDEVLTTNFDNILERACRLLDCDPQIVDLTTIPNDPDVPPWLDDGLAADAKTVHLHGRVDGFRILTKQKCQMKQGDNIGMYLKKSLEDKVVFVIGYSGEEDLTFEWISEALKYASRVYWYTISEPSGHVNDLLSRMRNAYLVRGDDANSLLPFICDCLESWPPVEFVDPTKSISSIKRYVNMESMPSATAEKIEQHESDIDSLIGTSEKLKDIRNLIEQEEHEDIFRRHSDEAKRSTCPSGMKNMVYRSAIRLAVQRESIIDKIQSRKLSSCLDTYDKFVENFKEADEYLRVASTILPGETKPLRHLVCLYIEKDLRFQRANLYKENGDVDELDEAERMIGALEERGCRQADVMFYRARILMQRWWKTRDCAQLYLLNSARDLFEKSADHGHTKAEEFKKRLEKEIARYST